MGSVVEAQAPEGGRVEERRTQTTLLAPFLCGMFAFVDLYCTQPLLPLLEKVFRADEAHVSLTVSASTLGVAISALLLAAFGERLDRRRTILRAMGLLAASTLLCATATSLPMLAMWRGLQGVVTPGVFILTVAYVTEEWPAREVPGVMSVYVAGTVFGGFTGRLLGGLVGARFGWRTVFVLLGVLGLLGMVGTRALLRPGETQRPVAAGESRWAPLVRNLWSRQLQATFGIGFCLLFTLVAIFSYVTFYLTAAPFGLSTEAVSAIFAVYLVGLVATLLMGRVLPRIGLRTGMLVAIGMGLLGAWLTMVHSVATVACGLALVGSCVFIAQTCANSFLRDAAPEGGRVSAAGLYICVYYVGGTVGGVLPGVVWRFGGWSGTVAMVMGLLLAAAGLTWFGWRVRRDPVPL